jgi:peptidoglycan/xylan/chitin deacetylase (PgdA/CDA1 family)
VIRSEIRLTAGWRRERAKAIPRALGIFLFLVIVFRPGAGAGEERLPPPHPAPTAQDAEFKVLPWNGAKGAVSLTFDDADPSHLDVAIPELDRHGLKGTFFLITSKITKPADWKKAMQSGHEMGSHSVNHRNPGDLKSDAEIEKEVDGAAKSLEQLLGRAPATFAYPFAGLTEPLKARVGKIHLLARGGGGAPYLAPASEPDWLNLPSQATMTETPLGTYLGWADKAQESGSWTVFMIHGLEGTPWGWQPIPKKTFAGLLDHLKEGKLWVAPFGEVGCYWKAQKILEKSRGEPAAGGRKWSWEVPDRFPPGTTLKVKADLLKCALFQKNGKIVPDKDGLLAVRFDERELILKPAR